MNSLLAALLLLASPEAKKAEKPKKKPPIDISIPSLGDLPKADGLQKTVEQPRAEGPSAPVEAKYEVVRVVHAQQLVQRAESYDVKGPVSRIDVTNLPTTVPGFHSLVRVRSNEKVGAPISVSLSEPGGHVVLQSEGNLVFGTKTEAEFVVDWDPFTLAKPGSYTFEVSVAGKSVSKTPLPVIQALSAELREAPMALPDGGS